MVKLYDSKEWKSLNPLDRAQLLLVLEGLKRGTIIGSDKRGDTLDILNRRGFEVRPMNKGNFFRPPTIVTAKPEDFLRLTKMTKQGVHPDKRTGWLLGYPECCTDEYIRPRTPEQEKAQNNNQHQSYRFGQELTSKIARDGNYPEIFDYRVPSFTPCRIDCPNATRLLTSWKQALDKLDPKAAEHLMYCNRAEFPERLVHKDWLKQKKQQVYWNILKSLITR